VRIGEVASRTGVGVSALRAWERRFGLLEPRRSPGGQRQYSEADVDRVLTVRRLLAEGLTLPTAIARATDSDGFLPAADSDQFLLNQIVQTVNQGICVARDGFIRFANRRMAELLGVSLDELLATPSFDFIDPEHVPLVKEKLDRLRQGFRQVYEARILRADGSTFLAEVSASPIHDRAGRYEGAVAVVTDLTSRKDEEAQARFRAALLEAVGEAVIAATPEGMLTYVNPAAARLFGWSATEVLGVDTYAFPTALESFDALVEIHAKVLAGQTYSGDLPMVRRDGSRFVGHFTSGPVLGEGGELVGVIGVIRDITDRLRVDHELRTRELEGATLALLGVRALNRETNGAGIEDAVLRESCEATRRVLGVDRAAIHEVVGSGELAMRAASPPVGEPTVLPAGSRSLAGYTALARTVVVVEDAGSERRFDLGSLGPDTRSAIGAPVFGPLGVRAVLTAESSTPEAFADTVHFVQGIANVVGAALQ
jgi:PAS domain S-box-containing protein